MCQYFSKSEKQCSQAMRRAAKEAVENNMHHHDTMKAFAKAFLNNRECFVQEAVYHILPELKLSKNLPAFYFANTNLPEERVHVLLPEKELNELRDDSSNIFKRSNIDRYMEAPSATLCNGKYDFCQAEFLAYYTLENKLNKTCEYQPDELHDNLIENNREECCYQPKTELTILGETIQCRKVRRVLGYHVLSKLLSPEKFAYDVLLLFYPFIDEQELLSGFPPIYQNKLQEEEVQDVANIRQKCNLSNMGI